VRAIRERDRHLGALLDEQDRDAAVADSCERLEQRVDDGRGESERRLVEEQDVGACDKRPRNRQLLLLATRESAGVPPREVANDREERLDPCDVGVETVSAAPRGEA
jgi:hypothetical protein